MYNARVRKIGISVITPDGSLRNSHLESQLELVSKKVYTNDFIFRGVDGRAGSFKEFEFINQRANSIILGRELLATEAACLVSHKLAYASSSSDWLVVLEDDAQICSVPAFETLLVSLAGLKEFSRPTILLLFVGKNGVFSRRSSFEIAKINFYKVFKIPTTTCAYVINKEAMELAVRDSDFIGTADWPTWSKEVDFYLTTSSIVSHEGRENSIVSQSTAGFGKVWPKFQYSPGANLKELVKGSIPSQVGGRHAYWRIFTRPLLFWSLSRLPILNFFFSRINV